MSTIKVNSIKNTSTDDGGIAIDNSGHVQIDGQQLPTTGALSNRNLIINGAMQVAQRGTSFTSQTAGAYYLDRFKIHTFGLGSGVYQVDQSTDAPDGFQNSFKVSCTTADTSTDANAQMSVLQALEGLDTNFLKYYEANPDTVTVSFYVKSNRTGTFSAALKLSDNGSTLFDGNTRIYNFTYSISSGNTWERKTVSITLDSATTETKVVNNGYAVAIQWWQLAGTSRDSAAANSWVANTNAAPASANLDLLESTSNNWFITGVQLEVGEKATPFEHRSYGDELQRCERYFTRMPLGDNDIQFNFARFSASSGAAYYPVHLPTTMRAAPTFALQGTMQSGSGYTGAVQLSNNGSSNDSTVHVALLRTSSGSFSASSITFAVGDSSDCAWDFSSEL